MLNWDKAHVGGLVLGKDVFAAQYIAAGHGKLGKKTVVPTQPSLPSVQTDEPFCNTTGQYEPATHGTGA